MRSDESATIERIDTLESADEDCDPTCSAERREAKERFRKAFARLSKQEREVAVLLYVEDWTLRDIGERLGVSESRISQIHTQLRRRLYEQLSGELPLFSQCAESLPPRRASSVAAGIEQAISFQRG